MSGSQRRAQARVDLEVLVEEPSMRDLLSPRLRGWLGDHVSVHVRTSVFRELLAHAGVRTAAKPEWARRIGPHLNPQRNTSASFRTFLSGASELVGASGGPTSNGKDRT